MYVWCFELEKFFPIIYIFGGFYKSYLYHAFLKNLCPESNAQTSFHNCTMTIFNYLKIVHELNQKSMSNWLLFYMRLFLLIFGSYPCYWTVFSWKKETNMFTVLALTV